MQDTFDVTVKLRHSLYLHIQHAQEEDCLAGHMDIIHRTENSLNNYLFKITYDR